SRVGVKQSHPTPAAPPGLSPGVAADPPPPGEGEERAVLGSTMIFDFRHSFTQQAPARDGEILDRLHDQPVDDQIEAADHDHAGHDAVDLAEGARAENEIAETALAHQHFGGDQRAPAVAHAEPQADHDDLQRARQLTYLDSTQ